MLASSLLGCADAEWGWDLQEGDANCHCEEEWEEDWEEEVGGGDGGESDNGGGDSGGGGSSGGLKPAGTLGQAADGA